VRKFIILLILLFPLLAQAANPLPKAQAFQFSAQVRDPNTLTLTWQISPGYYLYRERIKLDAEEAITLGRYQLPAGIAKHDAQLGDYAVFERQLRVALPILANQAGEQSLAVTYQGCAADGFCYPPTTQQIKVRINQHLELVQVEDISETVLQNADDDISSIQNLLLNNNLFMILIGFFAFGLLLSLTPCVLPMVPILSGLIIGQNEKMTTSKAFRLSLTYVIAMASTYALAGVLTALLGLNIQVSLQHPAIIAAFAGLFVFLALTMFGVMQLKLPARIQQRLTQLTHSQAGGTYLGVAGMGIVSTLIVSPCVTPPLVGTLGFIANSGDAILGGSALFSMGLGMGMPLLIVGTSSGTLLPKAGAWMDFVKNFFGVLLLIVAILLIDRIVPSWVSMFCLATLACGCAFYLYNLNLPKRRLSHYPRLAASVILMLYSTTLVLGATLGSDDLFHPLATLITASSAEHGITLRTVKTISDVEHELQQARGKPVMLDFYADWCRSCKIMANTTLKDPKVKTMLSDMIVLQADVTANDHQDKALQKHFMVVAPPTFVFFDKYGQEIKPARVIGELKVRDFLKRLQLAR